MKRLSYRHWRLLTRWLAKHRQRLLDERSGNTVKAVIGGTNVYIRTGEFPDGSLGEVFITINKEGDEMRVYDVLSIVISIALQYGVPLEVIVNKLKYQRMEPSGPTNNPDIPIASSISDFLARWLEMRYLDEEGIRSGQG